MTNDPKNDVELFAALCAELADPLVPRIDALAAAGVGGEAELDTVRASWSTRLATEPSLREKFRAAYTAARVRPRPGPGAPRREGAAEVPLLAPSGAPPVLTKPTVDIRRVAGVVSREDLDTTGEVKPRVAPVMPFVAA